MSLIIRPSGETHSHHFYGTGSRCFVVEIEQGWLNRLNEHRALLDESAQFDGGLSVWLAKRLYDEFHCGDQASALAIEGLMFEITAEASRHRVKALGCKPPSWLKQAEDLLKASFFETWALDGIANSVGIDPIHLAEGLTPSEYRAFRSR